MSIVPASRLSAADLSLLGNNLLCRKPSRQRRRRRQLVATVNRSLAFVGEEIPRLHRRPLLAM